jgi:pimeloyl-ACP methyl ester carboxylesterase
LLWLHGILGSGSNLRSIAKRVSDARGVPSVLVDLRLHGRSPAGDAPHTVLACAQDLFRLVATLDQEPDVVLGHSFGGKVALAYAGERAVPLRELWLLDSQPGARPSGQGSETTLSVFAALEKVGRVFPSRDAFIDELAGHGIERGIAQWLGMNLRPNPAGGMLLGLDVPALSELLHDYFALDLWPVFERVPAQERLRLVRGDASRVVDEATQARVHALEAHFGSRVALPTIQGAGHWLHVDQPDALVALLAG